MKQKISDKKILILIILLGFVLRLFFISAYEISYFQYDIGTIDEFDGTYAEYEGIKNIDRKYLKEGSHLEYIFTIYNTGKLPSSTANQFYHPPLSHAIFAGFMRLVSLFTDNAKILIESLEFVSIAYSMIIIYLSYKIMKEIGFSDKQTILPITIITFHPLSIFLAKMVNTDGLVSCFILLSILYTIRWYKDTNYKNLLMLTFAIGLGGMTKTSIIVMALPLVFIYMKKIIESVDDFEEEKKIIIQGILFSLITLPMIFWYQIRSSILYEYTPFAIAGPLETLKSSNMSFASRWLFSTEIFNKIFELNASNVWANLIISSINFLPDLESVVPYGISLALRGLSIAFIIISIIAMFKYTKNSEHKSILLFLVVTYIAWIIGYIYFNIQLPYTCTMHARYIITAMIIGIIYLGIFSNNLKSTIAKKTISIISIIFILLSIIEFINLIFMKIMYIISIR